MKTRLCKFLWVCLLLFTSAISIAYAQDDSGAVGGRAFGRGGRPFGGFGRFPTNAVRLDVEIANGQLSLAPLKGQVDVNQFNMGEGAYPTPIENVPATIANLAKYLAAADTNGNLNVSPSAADIQIKDLKLRGADMGEVLNAVGTATDGAVHGTGGIDLDGRYHFAFEGRPFASNLQPNPTRTVEVFEIRGYISSLGNKNDAEIGQKLDQVEQIITQTLQMLPRNGSTHSDLPNFTFHKGTGLLIVIGSPEAIEVTRKIVDALPGQSAAEVEQLARSAAMLKEVQQALDTPAGSKQK